MPNTKKYVSLDKLELYDEKIKKYLADADGEVLKDAKAYADGLAVNYEQAGAAATALADAKAYADGKDTAIAEAKQAGVDAADAAAVADGKADAAQERADAAYEYAAQASTEANSAQSKADEAYNYADAIQANVTVLEQYVGAIPSDSMATDVIGYIDEEIGSIDEEIGGFYADLDTRTTTLEGSVETLTSDVELIKGDYLTSTDKEELQGNIDAVNDAVELLTNGVSTEEVDGVNDLIQYVKEHGPEVTGIKKDIQDNAFNIANVTGRVEDLEGDMTDVQGAVATKVEQSAFDEAVEALEGKDTELAGKIAAIELQLGDVEGSVSDLIADAKEEAISTAAGDATTKANAAEAAAKAYTDAEVGKDRTRLDALEAIEHHNHANKAELDLIASGDKSKWDAAAAIAHEHANKGVLDGITAEKVTAWDTVTSKAAQSDLNSVSDRVGDLETWHTNFTEVSEEEINNLFV